MRILQLRWTEDRGWAPALPQDDTDTRLVLAFGSPEVLDGGAPLAELAAAFPGAALAGCSTAGEIAGATILDHSLVATAVAFEGTPVRTATVDVRDTGGGMAAGRALAGALPRDGLRHVLVFSDGLLVNGSDLVRGLLDGLPGDVCVTGGLAGDGRNFVRTLVVRDGRAATGCISAVGLYGPRIRIGYGSMGGWDPFGPERLITSSRGNVLLGMDGKSALELYKLYLGRHAEGLPATGLRFPLSIRADGSDVRLVRTVLSVSEEEQSMTFAGDMPEGAFARLMKTNPDRLVDGAMDAARECAAMGPADPELVLMVSCAGRRMVLGEMAEEELEAVRDVFGRRPVMAGFYSYGEIAPSGGRRGCELHNQTMTVTALAED